MKFVDERTGVLLALISGSATENAHLTKHLTGDAARIGKVLIKGAQSESDESFQQAARKLESWSKAERTKKR
jgi:hypothetical protein